MNVDSIRANAPSRAARSVAVMAACELLGKGATLVFTVSAARALGPSGFGAFSYAVTFGLLLATLPSWGFDNVMLRRASADPTSLQAALAQALVCRALIAVPVLVIGGAAGAASQVSGPARTAVVLILAASLLESMGDAGRAAEAARERTGSTSIALLLQRLATTGLALTVLVWGGHLEGVCVAYLVSSVLGLALTALALRRLDVRPDWGKVNRPSLVRMRQESFYIGLNTLVAMALFRVDAVILHQLKGNMALAQYAVAYRLLETVLFLNWVVSRALFPSMARESSDARQVLLIVERGLAVLGAAFVPYAVFLLLEGESVLRLLFGTEYLQDSTLILRWLAFAPLTFGLTFLVGYALLARNLNREVLLASAVGAVFNIGANMLLIPRFSGVGAAFTTTASYLLSAAMMLWFVRDGGRLRVERALALPVAAAVPLIVALVLLRLPVMLEALAVAPVYCSSYLLLAYWRDRQQLVVLRSMVRRA